MNTKAKKVFEKTVGPMTFGTFLLGARTTALLSQSDLARKLKVSRSMICDIEKGRVSVSPSLAIKIAKVAGFPKEFALKYCFEDQLLRANIKEITVELKSAV
jgi:DNA-binding XRE family transcriptional regulator